MITPRRLAVFALALVAAPAPAAADVVRAENEHFVTRSEAIVSADTKATWLALISPGRWWADEHSWSGDAANLTLTPQAGGCFCETIPEVEDADRITLEGSVEHMRVVQAYPERALRMVGALGPLQSEPVTGVLTIALSEVEGGTKIVWEYNVAGAMRYDTADIAKAVDGVMTVQLGHLAQELGVVERPAAPDARERDNGDGDDADSTDGTGNDVENGEAPGGDASSVDSAFDDF